MPYGLVRTVRQISTLSIQIIRNENIEYSRRLRLPLKLPWTVVDSKSHLLHSIDNGYSLHGYMCKEG